MSNSTMKLLRTHGALSALIVAALFAASVLVLSMSQTFVGTIGIGGLPVPQLVSALGWASLTAACLGLGFFASLWLLAPIAGELRVGHVITRSVLALGVGVSLFFVVTAIFAVVGAFQTSTQSLFANSFPWPSFQGDAFMFGLLGALRGAFTVFISTLPLAVLTGIFFWIWRVDHPPKRPVAGILDV